VSLVGNNFGTLQVEAVAKAYPDTALPDQTITLDGRDTIGDIVTATWSVISGGTVSILPQFSLGVAKFLVPVGAGAGNLDFRLIVNEGILGMESISTVSVAVTAQAAPFAIVSPPTQQAIALETVTLNGDQSTFAAQYLWEQLPGGPVIVIRNADKAVATFDLPRQLAGATVPDPVDLTFKLTVSNTASPPQSHSFVTTITQKNDIIANPTLAELRTDMGQLRITGTVDIYSHQNKVGVYDGDGPKGPNVTYEVDEKIGEGLVDPLTVCTISVSKRGSMSPCSTS
jgi:hypothetical protein